MRENENNTNKYQIRPASPEEAGLFYVMPPEKDAGNKETAPLEIRSLADLKRAIKPGAELMATYHAKHPEIVGLVRVVTEVQTNAFYSVIKDQPNHEYTTCNHGKGFARISKRRPTISLTERPSGYWIPEKATKAFSVNSRCTSRK